MSVTCQRCGGTFAETEVGDRFQGTCPKCLAEAALRSTAGAPDAPPDDLPPLDPGQAFQGLEIVERIGAGGMGVVYKARQPNLDRFVALKVLPRHLAGDADFVERFRREAKALASLSHANIVGVHDFGVAGDVPYLVMEYVDGVNLRALLGEKRLSPEQAFKIVPQLCDALEYAHEEGIVHRDIKPENILVDRKGRVKIADFGLAKILGGDRTQLSPITRTAHMMGTPSYMAPEQYEDPKRVDHRADIYSMGVVFYEMLTGELPMGIFAPPSQKVQVDVRFDEVVLKALAKEPDRRYQHASEVKNEVTRITVSAPAAKSDAEVQRNAKKVIRLARRAQFFAILAIMLIGVAIYRVGDSVWESFKSSYANRGSSSTSASSLPTWMDQLQLFSDDFPGACTLSARSCDGTEHDNLGAVPSYLYQSNMTRFDKTAVRSARLMLFEPGPIGFVAFEAKDAAMTERVAASVASRLETPRWSWTKGIQGVVAFVSLEERPSRASGGAKIYESPSNPESIAAFEQLANLLASRLGAARPYKSPRTAWGSLLTEGDLPIGVSISRQAGWSPDAGGERRKSLDELFEVRPEAEVTGISEAAWLRMSPGGTRLVALDIPKSSRRLAFLKELGPPAADLRRVVVLGTVVVVCERGGTESLAQDEFEGVKLRWEQKLGFAPTDAERLPEALRDAAGIPEELAGDLQDRTGWRSLDETLDARLTALLLHADPLPDVERPPFDCDTKLLEALRSKGRWGETETRVSVLHPAFVKSMGDGTFDVEVPEVVRFRAGFATRSGAVVEFRLPKANRRVMHDDGVWRVMPMKNADARVSIASDEADARFMLERIARLAGADLVCGDWPTTRVRVQFSDVQWSEALASTAASARLEVLRMGLGVVRVRRSVPFAKEPPPRPASAPDDPRVTLDVGQADVRDTILRFAEAGRASVVLAEQVGGRCSLRLVDVPWIEALCAVAEASGNVAWRDRAGVLRVVPAWKGDVEAEHAIPGGGATASAGAPRVTIDLRDADLREAIALLARQSGKSVVLGVDGDRRVTAVFRDVPWTDALTAIAWTSGLAPVEAEGGIVRLIDPMTLPSQTLKRAFFQPEDLPEGWAFAPKFGSMDLPLWTAFESGLTWVVGGMQDLVELKAEHVAEAYVASFQEAGGAKKPLGYFVVLRFKDRARLDELETAAKAKVGHEGAKRTSVLRHDDCLALGYLFTDDDAGFDCLVKLLDERLVAVK